MEKEYSTDRRAISIRKRRERAKADGIVPVQIALGARDKAILESIATIDQRPEQEIIHEILTVGLRAMQGNTLQMALGKAFERAS